MDLPYPVHSPRRKSWMLQEQDMIGNPAWKSSSDLSPQNSPASSNCFPSPSTSPARFSANDYPLVLDWEKTFETSRHSSTSSQATLTKPVHNPAAMNITKGTVYGRVAEDRTQNPQGLKSAPLLAKSPVLAAPPLFKGRQSVASFDSVYNGILADYGDVDSIDSCQPQPAGQKHSEAKSHSSRSSFSGPSLGPSGHASLESAITSDLQVSSRRISLSTLADDSQIAQMNRQASLVRACRKPSGRGRKIKLEPVQAPESNDSESPLVQELAVLCADLKVQRRPSQIRVRKDHWRAEKRQEREVQRLKKLGRRNRKGVTVVRESAESEESAATQAADQAEGRDFEVEGGASVEALQTAITRKNTPEIGPILAIAACEVTEKMEVEHRENTDESKRGTPKQASFSLEESTDESKRSPPKQASFRLESGFNARNLTQNLHLESERDFSRDGDVTSEGSSSHRDRAQQSEPLDIGQEVMRTELLRQSAENEALGRIREERREFFKKNKEAQIRQRTPIPSPTEQRQTPTLTRTRATPTHSPNATRQTTPSVSIQSRQTTPSVSIQSRQTTPQSAPIQSRQTTPLCAPIQPTLIQAFQSTQSLHSPIRFPAQSPNPPNVAPPSQSESTESSDILLAQQHALRYVRAAERDRQRVLNTSIEPPKDEYSVIDDGIPPYQAHLHRYLDLMSYDERFSPVLRVNRYLVPGEGELAEAINKFRQFNLIATDLWNVSHVDERDYERLIPELIPTEDSIPHT